MKTKSWSLVVWAFSRVTAKPEKSNSNIKKNFESFRS